MSQQHTIEWWPQRGEVCVGLRVTYDFTAGYGPKIYGDNPDPGAPDQFDLVGVDVELQGGWVPFELTAQELQDLQIFLSENHVPDDGPDCDHLRDERIDRELSERF